MRTSASTTDNSLSPFLVLLSGTALAAQSLRQQLRRLAALPLRQHLPRLLLPFKPPRRPAALPLKQHLPRLLPLRLPRTLMIPATLKAELLSTNNAAARDGLALRLVPKANVLSSTSGIVN